MLTRIFWYKEKKRNRKSFISQRKENNAQLGRGFAKQTLMHILTFWSMIHDQKKSCIPFPR